MEPRKTSQMLQSGMHPMTLSKVRDKWHGYNDITHQSQSYGTVAMILSLGDVDLINQIKKGMHLDKNGI